jgi:hypothetical protein
MWQKRLPNAENYKNADNRGRFSLGHRNIWQLQLAKQYMCLTKYYTPTNAPPILYYILV